VAAAVLSPAVTSTRMFSWSLHARGQHPLALESYMYVCMHSSPGCHGNGTDQHLCRSVVLSAACLSFVIDSANANAMNMHVLVGWTVICCAAYLGLQT
jgi:hypothetical protein